MFFLEKIVELIGVSNHGVEGIFFDIGIIIILATVLGFSLKLLKQPLIPAYVLAGVLLGPYGLSMITNPHVIETLSEMGIAFLLFVVGIEMDFKRLKSIGLIATIGGTIQILILSSMGWLIGIFLGLGPIEAIYCGLIVSFSSTMVVIKLLSDKNELDTLHGRIIIGFLLMEDIFAILALLIISNMSQVASSGIITVVALLLIKILIILLFSFLVAKFIFPPLFKLAAESQEILFLLAITTCFVFAFLSSLIGLSIAIGAFIAGLSVANLPYNYEIMGKIKALLIFFTTIFFAALGMKLQFISFSMILIPLVIFIAFISLIKPLITSFICSFFGYKRRTSLLASITLAQTSEFSLIIVALGVSPAIGQLVPGSIIPSLAILLAIITMVITSYTIKFDEQIYEKIKNVFHYLDKIGTGNMEVDLSKHSKNHDVILIGHDRIGYTILNTLQKQKKKIIVVDYNPETVKQLISNGINCIYGDISDTDVLDRLNVSKAKLIISTVNELHDNMTILKYARKLHSSATTIMTALKVEDALQMYAQGADYVVLPHFLGGHHVSLMLEEEALDINSMLKKKLTHIKELEHRKHMGHYHPRHNNK